jgi:GT2 family glycosyltransferase
MSVAVVVPTYNGAHVLGNLLRSLRGQTVGCEVLVVDNASEDRTLLVLEREFPEARCLRLEENVGFARAVNLAVSRTDAETIVLLNNDVVCGPDFLEHITAVLDPRARIVMAAGVLLQAAAPSTIDTAGILFDRTLFAIDHLYGQPVDVLECGAPDPLGPSGGAAAYDRAAFDAAGGFDERFFAYLEDVDLCVRLLRAGGRCRLATRARAVHRHSATLGSGSPKKNALMGWGRGYMFAKYRLYRQPRVLARVALSEAVIVLGQVVVDRTTTGIGSRIEGMRAGLKVPAEAVPSFPEQALRLTFAEALEYRLRRRRRPSRRVAGRSSFVPPRS